MLGIGANCHEMLGHRRLITECRQQPVAGAVGISHGFISGEGLGGNNKHRFRWVQPLRGFHQMGGIEV